MPEDYNKTDNTNHFQSCSLNKDSPQSSADKCLIASKDDLNELTFGYKSDETIYCKKLPPIVIKVDDKNESVEVLIKDFRLIITNDKNKTFVGQTKDFCPIEANSDRQEKSWFAGWNKIWISIGVSIAGALIMFGLVFVYETFVRNRFWYYMVDDQEGQDNQNNLT